MSEYAEPMPGRRPYVTRLRWGFIAVTLALGFAVIWWVLWVGGESRILVQFRLAVPASEAERIAAPLNTPVESVGAHSSNHVIRSPTLLDGFVLWRARGRADVLGAWVLSDDLGEFSKPVPPQARTPRTKAAIAVSPRIPTERNARSISIPDFGAKWIMLQSPNIAAGMQLDLGEGQRFKVVRSRPPGDATAGEQVLLDVEDPDGVPALIVLSHDVDGLRANIEGFDRHLSLIPTGADQHVVIEHDLSELPPEADVMGDDEPAQPPGATTNRPESAPANSIPIVTLAVGFTKGATDRLLLARERSLDAGREAREARLTSELAALLDAHNEAFQVGGRRWGLLKMGPVLADLKHATGQTAQTSLSMVCASDPARRSPAGSALQTAMLRSRADIGILVVEPNWCLPDNSKTQCDAQEPVPCALPGKNPCGLSTVVRADWKRAFAVVNVDCLTQASILHEVAHLIAGNHANPGDVPGPAFARAYIDRDPRLSKRWMTIMGSFTKKDCEDCVRVNRFSDPDDVLTIKMKSGATITRPLGSRSTDNRRAVAERMVEVSGFGAARLRAHCEASGFNITLPFRFNAPNLRKESLFVLADAIAWSAGTTASADRALGLRRDVGDYFDLCGAGRLRVVGHADSVPGPYPEYNLELSRERAQLVAEWLRQAIPRPGVAVCVEARGAAAPSSTERGQAGRARNRRVEIYAESTDTC